MSGHLLSGSDDAQICLWDINASSAAPAGKQNVSLGQEHGGRRGEGGGAHTGKQKM